MRKKISLIIFIVLSVISTATNYPIKIVDAYGREVRIEKEPQKIISIAPNITDILFNLELDKKIIGRSTYCDYPSEAENVEIVGGMMDPNLEKILKLNPDLILVSTHFNKKTLKKIEAFGIPIIGIYGEEKFTGVYDVIKKVAEITNKEEKGKLIISDIQKRVQNIKDDMKDSKKVKLYYVISYGRYGDYTAGGNTYINDMIEIAGGKNIAKELQGWKYSLEKVIEKNPKIIICSKYGGAKKGLENTNGYSQLEAVKNGKLYEIDNNLLDRQGSRLIEGLEELNRIIKKGIEGKLQNKKN